MNDTVSDKIARIAKLRDAQFINLAQKPQGLDWCREHTDLVDLAVQEIFSEVTKHHPSAPPVSLVAVGGYGRRELSPFSDVDILVIPATDGIPELDQMIKDLYFHIHEALRIHFRIEPGYAYRLISDAVALDAKTQTGVLDARLICGSHQPYSKFLDLYRENFSAGEFILAKIQERQENFARFHDTPLVTQPHLKEGAGGMRCFHCANWIRAVVELSKIRATDDYDLLISYRNLLHYVSGKRQENLTWGKQADIADLLGSAPQKWMPEVSEAMLSIHAEYQQALDTLQEARFTISEGVVAVRGEARIHPTASLSSAALGISIASQLNLRIEHGSGHKGRQIDAAEALHSIGTGEHTIRNLDRSGLLGELIPELTACRTLMPDDPSHEFTVFEHSLRLIRNLDHLEHDPFLNEIKQGLSNLSTLYLAGLLHDVGKIDPARDHSEYGVELLHTLAQRWNLASNIRENVSWLIQNHLLIDQYIRTRDIENAQTSYELAQKIQTVDRLDMLTLLTYADVNAVNRNAWTPMQDSFLRLLHRNVSEILQNSEADNSPSATDYRKLLAREMLKELIPDEDIKAFLSSMPAHYLLSTPSEVAGRHLRYERMAREGRASIEFLHRQESHCTEVTIVCKDAPGLLNRILGAFYAYDLRVDAIRASTTESDTPVAIDTFILNFNGNCVPPATERQLYASLLELLSQSLDITELLLKRGKNPHRKQDQMSFSFTEGNPGILEIRAPRGRGMPYRTSRMISEKGWSISTARFGTWAGKSIATYYVTSQDKKPLSNHEINNALTPEV